MCQATTALGHATESQFNGPPSLQGASVVALGSGLAGMLVAYELRKAAMGIYLSRTTNQS